MEEIAITLQDKLAVELPLEWMSCIASPAAVCPSGNGIRDHPSIAECGLRIAEFLMSSCFVFNYFQFEIVFRTPTLRAGSQFRNSKFAF
jgi:hypothetical protein